jgi:hypothetical protein
LVTAGLGGVTLNTKSSTVSAEVKRSQPQRFRFPKARCISEI